MLVHCDVSGAGRTGRQDKGVRQGVRGPAFGRVRRRPQRAAKHRRSVEERKLLLDEVILLFNGLEERAASIVEAQLLVGSNISDATGAGPGWAAALGRAAQAGLHCWLSVKRSCWAANCPA